MEKEIFVSYSRHDSAIVDAIVQRLESKGFSIWVDHDGIGGGEDFKREIACAIEDCEVVLFFSSQHSNNSEWTAKEIGVAVYEKKHIIPILLDHSKYNPAVKFDLINLDYLDFTNLSKWDKVMARLEKALSAKCSHHAEAGVSSENQRKVVGTSVERPRIVVASDKAYVGPLQIEPDMRRSTEERKKVARQKVWLSVIWKLFFAGAIIFGLIVLFFLANYVGLFTYHEVSARTGVVYYRNYIFDKIVRGVEFYEILFSSFLYFIVCAIISYIAYVIKVHRKR